MIKKTTVCCLVFLLLLTSVQPVFAQESQRSANTATTKSDITQSAEQLPEVQATETTNRETILTTTDPATMV